MSKLFDSSLVFTQIPELMEYLPITLELALISMLFALLLGFLLALVKIRNMKILTPIVNFVISLVRGTPVLEQLYIAYFGIPMIFKAINQEFGTAFQVANIPGIVYAAAALLRCIDQLEIPEKGRIRFDGRDIDLSRKNKADMLWLRQNTGMVFQRFHLFEKKTALENVMEGLIVVQRKPAAEARKIALRELDKVGMTPWANHYPRHMSGGQQQRVAIARVLAMRPQLLLDEPTSALDPELVGEVLDVIREIADEGLTMLLVSHEMSFVRSVTNRVIFLDKGHVEDGTPKEVFERPQNPRTQEFLRKMYLMDAPEYNI